MINRYRQFNSKLERMRSPKQIPAIAAAIKAGDRVLFSNNHAVKEKAIYQGDRKNGFIIYKGDLFQFAYIANK